MITLPDEQQTVKPPPRSTTRRACSPHCVSLLLAAALLGPASIAGSQEAARVETPPFRAPDLSRDADLELPLRLPVAAPPPVRGPAPGEVADAGTVSRLVARATAGVVTWQPQGPAPSFFGQPEQIADGPVAGAIEAVAAHPADPDILWIGAVNGGIFRTNDATSPFPLWQQQSDSAASLSISALELDPTDGTHQTLVAGLGAISSFASVNGGLTGILRTTNGGATWSNPGSTGLVGGSVSGVAPRGATVVVAISEAPVFADTGIWRSTNSGASFTQISNGVGSGLPEARSFDLVGDPADSGRLYTIVRNTGVVGASGIYRSGDSGATWTKISDATQDALLNDPATDANLAVSADGSALFAATCNASGRLSALRRSGNPKVAVPSWTNLDLPTTVEQAAAVFGVHPGSQCFIHLSLVADPTNSQVVYVGGDRQPGANEVGGPGPLFPNSIGAQDFSGRLFKVNAALTPGSQATPITHCQTPLPGCKGSARTASGSAPHADSREMVFDADGDLIQTDDGGIYRHTDPAGTGGDWFSMIGNLGVIEQHDIDFDRISGVLLSGNQDNGTSLQDSPGSPWWVALFGGDGGDVAAVANDPIAGRSTRYFSAQFLGGFTRAVFDADGVFQSAAFPTLISSTGPFVPAFLTQVAPNPFAPASLLLGGAQRVFVSNDRGDNIASLIVLTCPNPCFPANPTGGRTLQYGVASDVGAIGYVSGDDLLAFNDTTAPQILLSDPNLLDTSALTGIVMDPTESETLVAIDSDQVYRTTNSGNSYTEITGNLQSLGPGRLTSVEYLGTDLVVGGSRGVFTSSSASGFTTWSKLGAGLPNAPVYRLVYDATTDTLHAGTLGRGTWILGDSGCPTVLDLVDQTLSSDQAFLSLGTIATRNLVIDAEIRFDAVTHIRLGSGTVITNGASFAANVDPTLTCP